MKQEVNAFFFSESTLSNESPVRQQTSYSQFTYWVAVAFTVGAKLNVFTLFS